MLERPLPCNLITAESRKAGGEILAALSGSGGRKRACGTMIGFLTNPKFLVDGTSFGYTHRDPPRN